MLPRAVTAGGARGLAWLGLAADLGAATGATASRAAIGAAVVLLATTAWHISELTEDRDFIAEVYAGLSQFFERWFQQDTDHDGLPEIGVAGKTRFRMIDFDCATPGPGCESAYVRWSQPSQAG